MTDKRYIELDSGPDPQLTPEELKEGWHFCPDWDYMLLGPGMSDLGGCLCINKRGVK